MRKIIAVVGTLFLLGVLFFPRHDADRNPPAPEARSERPLPEAHERHANHQIVQQDVRRTEELHRNHSTEQFREAARRFSAMPESRIRGQLHAYRRSQPQTEMLLWLPAGSGTDRSIRSGKLEPAARRAIAPQLEKAKGAAAKGLEYCSTSIRSGGASYFVVGVPASKRNDVLIGVVNQRILSMVEADSRRNLRLVLYPDANRRGLEAAEAGTLRERNVDHPQENEGLNHYYKNQVVVKFKRQPDERELMRITSDIRSPYVRKLGYTYIFETDGMHTKQLIQYFRRHEVEYAEPHYLYTTNGRMNGTDPGNGCEQGGNPRGTGAEGAALTAEERPNDQLYPRYQWNLPLTRTETGWRMSKGSPEVVVAVVDTGVDLQHPDLQGRLVNGHNFVTGKANPQDDVGHGTHVAGIIAAEVNNDRGIAGMTWNNPIMPVKVLDASGAGNTYNVAQGIIWAADHGARVINLSLGNYAQAEFLHDAVRYAFDKDVVLVSASGNDNTEQPGYPAAYPEVLAVAATDANNRKASFSNYGDYIDVSAPGVSIASTYPGNQYAALSGTSMSSPHVAALAALIRSVNPQLKNTEVMDVIRRSASDLGDSGRDNIFGHGEIDVDLALRLASEDVGPNAGEEADNAGGVGQGFRNLFEFLFGWFK